MNRCYGIKLGYEEQGKIVSFISFITLDLEQARRYLEKYNTLVEKLRVHYFINRNKSDAFKTKLDRYLVLFDAIIVEFELR